ncbi:hypothetical protein [Rhodococcus tibetensis]|uniref:5'-nucleotidase n=1 Tax=Rhodococcus tibetensis TaxID=2965064 RepID=A0ABT1QD51_9NOCA|nr:hypothetical protein [Rhodococcus sp. FXJ9.536]MCQ4119670.1 hypothetical protein [Rhodococcus sp. FXJ9.536]
MLNVNAPDIPLDKLKGLRPAPLAAFGAVQANIGEVDDGFMNVTFAEIHAEDNEDSEETDAGVLVRGWASATALRVPFEAADVDISTLNWTR